MPWGDPDKLFRSFAHDLFRFFVLAQAQESRLAQIAITRPLGETNLADEFRFQPEVSEFKFWSFFSHSDFLIRHCAIAPNSST